MLLHSSQAPGKPGIQLEEAWKAVRKRRVGSSVHWSSGLEKRHRSEVQLSEGLTSFVNHVCLIEALLKPPVYHSTIVLRGLKGTLNWAPIMPRDTSILANYNLVLCWFCSRVGAECPLCVGMTLGEIACQRHMKARASGVTISPKPSLLISLIIPPVFRKQPIDTWTTLVGNLWNFD